MKRHLFYLFLLIFAATAIVTLLGITGMITISTGYLSALLSAFLIESAAAVVALFARTDFYSKEDDRIHSEAILALQKEHSDTINSLKNEYLASQEQNQKIIAGLNQSIQRLNESDSRNAAEIGSLRFDVSRIQEIFLSPPASPNPPKPFPKIDPYAS